MIRFAIAIAIAALLLASCGDDDPCAGIETCVRVDVDSTTITTIDELELDVVYGDRHATTTTQAPGGGTTRLPLSTAIALDVPGTEAIAVGVVAAGKRGTSVLGTGAASTSVTRGGHATVVLELASVEDCVAGGLYCGGDQLAGDPDTLYQCNLGGVPIARGVCAYGCRRIPDQPAVCRASPGTCKETGRYCGGDKLEGDPQTLYVCENSGPGASTVCPDGCVVNENRDDTCR